MKFILLFVLIISGCCAKENYHHGGTVCHNGTLYECGAKLTDCEDGNVYYCITNLKAVPK